MQIQRPLKKHIATTVAPFFTLNLSHLPPYHPAEDRQFCLTVTFRFCTHTSVGARTHTPYVALSRRLCHSGQARFTSAQGDSLSRGGTQIESEDILSPQRELSSQILFYICLANIYNMLHSNNSRMKPFCLILKDTIGTKQKPHSPLFLASLLLC